MAAVPSFDKIPALLVSLIAQVNELSDKVELQHCKQEADEPMGIDACAAFLTKVEGRPVTRTMVYGRVYRNRIPYSKNGGTLYFFASDIRKFIQTGKTEPRKMIIEPIREAI